MDDFREMERRFKRTPVKLVDHEGAHGVLRLHRRKTRLEVSSDTLIQFETADENGWFDLVVRALDGREVLLHHAISLGTGFHQRDDTRDAHFARVFPNVIIDDLRGLASDRLVQRIAFRMTDMSSFFYYRHTEMLRGFGATDEQLTALRTMRYAADEADDADGEFAPREIYVVHRMPIFVDFRVADRRYQVWAGGSFSGGDWDRVDARVMPVAEIIFDAPVGVEEALDRVWEWRRLFSQMAMCHLSIDGMSVRGSLEERAPSANVYLPNSPERRPLKGRRAPRPIHMPLNTWAERGRLAEAMRSWLEKDAVRRNFRARLDRVLTRMNRRIDPSDLVDLAAGVDGMAELTTATGITAEQVEAMVAAAYAAGEAAGAGIARDRVAGLLGSLSRPSLATRLSALAMALPSPPPPDDVSLLVSSAIKVRNAMAHGRAIAEQIQPRVSPTVTAIAAMCARYDLETCGFPARSPHDVRTMTVQRFYEGLEELRRLDNRYADS